MTTRYQSQGERSNFSGSEEAPAAETASASAGKGGQEQGDPALRTYLSLIRDIPVLSRDETSLLSDAISQGEAEFRGAMNRMPAVAFRVLSLWEDRQKDGRNTGLLAHGYHGDVRHDWASDIDKALHGLVAALGDQGLGSIADVTTQAVEVSPEAISCLEQCPILLELYIDIHRDFLDQMESAKSNGTRGALKEAGLGNKVARSCMAKASAALEEREKVRQEFSLHNLKLVVNVAKRFRGTALPFMDLIQEGNCGLMRAVEKFDASLGYAFSTYAVWWIEQSIIRSVQNQSRTIRTPSHIFQQRREFESASQRLRAVRSDEPGSQEIGEVLSINPEEVDRINAALRPVNSLDIPVSEDGSVTAADLLEAKQPYDMGFGHDQRKISSCLLHGMKSLSGREREILELRFGLKDGEELTLRETGERMGISRERVRQIQANALSRLRNFEEIDELGSYVEACHDAA